MLSHYISWWNVENLFDEENSPRRTDKVARALGKSIIGWTPELRDRKIAQLASIIGRMNGGAGPDLFGLCEVENAYVLNLLTERLRAVLPARTYAVAHADTRDERGIDVAFLFDPGRFQAPADQIFQHVVMRRSATREIFQVNFQTSLGHTLAVFGNHWPSRSGGQLESAGYRAVAGETLAYFHQRVLEEHGDTTAVLVMGDFNDEAFDASLVQYALSTRQREKVLRSPAPRLWNLTWNQLGGAEGTFYFSGEANLLDQFLVNRNVIREGSTFTTDAASFEILRFPEMVGSGPYPAPAEFGGMGSPVNLDGYSDHFPIGMRLTENS
jgi:predicted extracellular nuclease